MLWRRHCSTDILEAADKVLNLELHSTAMLKERITPRAQSQAIYKLLR